jgi:acetyltransferase-like isoleucine patch superfamily enzyme
VRRRARLGANSTILPGVEIGEDALIGAGSVVRERRVAPRTVWAGNPAVQVKDDITDLACFIGIYPHAYAWLEETARAEKGAIR